MIMKLHATDLRTAEAVRFIEKMRTGPFFLYLPYTAPHLALNEPAEWTSRYDRKISVEIWKLHAAGSFKSTKEEFASPPLAPRIERLTSEGLFHQRQPPTTMSRIIPQNRRLNRRRFLRGLATTISLPLLAKDARGPKDPNPMPAGQARQFLWRGLAELDESARVFEEHLDSLAIRDRDGLLCSQPYYRLDTGEIRLWKRADFKGVAEMCNYALIENPADWLNYENTVGAMGKYASYKVTKFLSSQRKDLRAIQDAQRAVETILAISREGSKFETGFLPKPFGGLATASESKSISGDNWEYTLFGCWHFRQATPNRTLAAEVDEEIIRWAEYCMRHDLAIEYCQREGGFSSVATPEKTLHYLGFYLAILILAGEISQDKKYPAVLNQRLTPIVKNDLFYKTSAGFAHPNQVNMVAHGLYLCIKKNILVDECTRALKYWWERGLKSISSDGLAYERSGVTDLNQVEPGWGQGAVHPSMRYMLWHSNEKGATSAITANSGALLDKVLPGEPGVEKRP